MAESPYGMILVETQGRVGVIRLNRPQALNALCDQLMEELGRALLAFDADDGVKVEVIALVRRIVNEMPGF